MILFLLHQAPNVFENPPTELRSLLLGLFFGLMLVMALYNLLLYFSLKDKAYLLYVGVVVFNILTTLATNGLGEEYLWPGRPGLDANIYVTFAGISMAFSSRFAAVFLQLKEKHKRLDRFMWSVAGLSLFMTLLTLFFTVNEIIGFARWLVLFSFPSYILVGFIVYRKGFKPALFYLVAWIPYILGIVIRTLHGAGWLPTNFFTITSIEIGGALEIILLSFALADRIRGMRREIAEKELEKEQFRTKLLEEQKVVLEQKVDERTKELSEANATKDKFFSIIAHDLRSPMIGLQGVGQKLEYFIKKNKQEKLLEMGGQIDQSLDQLNHLLNNLLNWATSQTGGVPHNPDSINITELIEENIELYKSLAESKEVKLINEARSLHVYVDSNTTSTIIRNILSNAIKFSPEGGKVTISTDEVDALGQVTIRDEGKGMNQETISKLFDENLQSKLGARGERGFGLGLKLCKEFVDMNSGTITVSSLEGSGTTFTICLPKEAKGILRSIDVA
ncbi:7TM diverse intracellular signaling domain-containing protein [Roseivirga sp.]|uniref:sensor histidine kinase n=1 Tax=Roseivirga sp. TaxID=1964215 RepID=UPI003B8C26E5